jgi:hypothetical protein
MLKSEIVQAIIDQTKLILITQTDHGAHYQRAELSAKLAKDQPNYFKNAEADYKKAIELVDNDNNKKAFYLAARARFYVDNGKNKLALLDASEISKLGLESLDLLEKICVRNTFEDLSKLDSIKKALGSSDFSEDVRVAFYGLVEVTENLSLASEIHDQQLKKHNLHLSKHDEDIRSQHEYIKVLLEKIEVLLGKVQKLEKNAAEMPSLLSEIEQLKENAKHETEQRKIQEEKLQERVDLLSHYQEVARRISEREGILTSIIKKEQLAQEDAAKIELVEKNSYSRTVYHGIHKLLTAEYYAALVVGSDLVEIAKTGKLGKLAQCVSVGAKQFSVLGAIAAKLVGGSMKKVDENQQITIAQHYADIVSGPEEMNKLAENIARKITLSLLMSSPQIHLDENTIIAKSKELLQKILSKIIPDERGEYDKLLETVDDDENEGSSDQALNQGKKHAKIISQLIIAKILEGEEFTKAIQIDDFVGKTNKILCYVAHETGFAIEGTPSTTPLAGLEVVNDADICSNLNKYWGKYTLSAIAEILDLRIDELALKEDVTILEGRFIDKLNNNIPLLVRQIVLDNSNEAILLPLNLYNKHAIGLIFENTKRDGYGYKLKITYIDPSNEKIHPELKGMLCSALEEVGIIIGTDAMLQELAIEPQKYANCGPEVIENFINYLTGSRVTQEEAILLHSELMERKLKSARDFHEVYELFNSTEQLDADAEYLSITGVVGSFETSEFT